ncbi:hypothetical protein [Brevundimonas viscosa]|uniref:Uncharacterized protein n=1 Tax=Brevundimonas viscosa TaxID=871741 RepID=A0A1I6SYD5_9CAUL|nr:hypothetical protein [Brevundimonas viscosa]SFS81880.1 hypothetical protein SAMN05192570_2790 [Brevundimonas viscosa]
MKPVVAYRHKLSWRIGRRLPSARRAMTVAVSTILVVAGFALLMIAIVVLSRRDTVSVGHVVATSTGEGAAHGVPAALVRLADARVVRIQTPDVAGCRNGDRLQVRETRVFLSRSQWLVRTRAAGRCHPFSQQ